MKDGMRKAARDWRFWCPPVHPQSNISLCISHFCTIIYLMSRSWHFPICTDICTRWCAHLLNSLRLWHCLYDVVPVMTPRHWTIFGVFGHLCYFPIMDRNRIAKIQCLFSACLNLWAVKWQMQRGASSLMLCNHYALATYCAIWMLQRRPP